MTPGSFENECFFIAPIGIEGSDIRRRSDGVLKFIVGRAAQELGLEAIRADRLAEPGIITRQVIDHLLHARGAVADLTGLNPNVFYELAVRHTARLPTVLIAEESEVLPFDIAQMRTIFFAHTDLESADKCRQEIVRQLREALGGAVESPIGASLELGQLEAGTAVERNVAELITSVDTLTRGFRELTSELRQQAPPVMQVDPQGPLVELKMQVSRLLAVAVARDDKDLRENISQLVGPILDIERMAQGGTTSATEAARKRLLRQWIEETNFLRDEAVDKAKSEEDEKAATE